ncbi:hypothetical protein VZT92_017424 [Zoarces viviparus]|uniref:Ig-like domain-containing protein n=1 Tax=Zoarces viviparus TaxID=48416 RepID=A0AAW1ES31_ZOAVI
MSALGDDVILPCHVEPQLSVENMTVIWWKPDEPPDPMGVHRYVHRYQSNRVEEDLQMKEDLQLEEDLQMEDLQLDSYVSRTSLFTDDLKHGNVSLKIKKVKLSDGGIYRCDVPQLASASKIILVVGAVVRTDCTPQSDPQCISCMNGTFMKKPNGLIRCFLCSSCDRGAGLFAQQGCTATADTVCDVVRGYFCKTLTDETGCSLAQKHSHCGPGEWVERPGTSRTDTVCGSCPLGYFSLEGLSCTVWTPCSETEVKVKEGSASSDVVCAAASRQRYGLIPAFILFTSTLVGLGIRVFQADLSGKQR